MCEILREEIRADYLLIHYIIVSQLHLLLSVNDDYGNYLRQATFYHGEAAFSGFFAVGFHRNSIVSYQSMIWV